MIVERINALRRAIALEGNIEDLEKEISNFPFDAEFPLVVVSPSEIISIMKRYVEGFISSEDLEKWAEFLECRDDVGFLPPKQDMLRHLIQRIANPALFGPLGRGVIEKLILELEGLG